MAASEDRFFCTVLHDVAPSSWDRYRRMIDAADALGIPLTLLVVPDHHREGTIDRFPHFCRAIERRLAKGDEVALHGYHHQDEAPLRFSLNDWIRRRLLTQEAEFAALPKGEAAARLERALRLFQRLGWPVAGFVPPGWAAAPDLPAELDRLGFRYMTTYDRVHDLREHRQLHAPVLVWSVRSGAHRAFSLGWNRHRLRRFAASDCLRLGLHPTDMNHPQVYRFWLDTLCRLATERCPATKLDWLMRRAPAMQS